MGEGRGLWFVCKNRLDELVGYLGKYIKKRLISFSLRTYVLTAALQDLQIFVYLFFLSSSFFLPFSCVMIPPQTPQTRVNQEG